MVFGEKLKELREDRGLRQGDIGALFDFGKSTVSQWESGKSQPEFDIVVKLADFFNVSIDYLMGRNGEAGNISFAGRYRNQAYWTNMMGG